FGLASSTSVEAAGLEGPATSLSASLVAAEDSGAQPQVTSTETGAALLFGFVFRDESGRLATKVRAIGTYGVVCGTGNVLRLDSGLGFYRMEVVDAATRAGCPTEGGALTFLLLYGSVDTGSLAIPSQVVRFAAGETLVASLTPAPASARSNWLGQVPTTSGADGLLTWIGANGTPIEDALAVLGVEVDHVSHYDAGLRRWLSYTPGGPSFVQTYTSVRYGDVVRVRVE
ncbi:MAG: hypothetical protein O2826_11235, partial [Chloroflexi bacterium]|nr:hypothetical protein [Chloroflexota bacterium]